MCTVQIPKTTAIGRCVAWHYSWSKSVNCEISIMASGAVVFPCLNCRLQPACWKHWSSILILLRVARKVAALFLRSLYHFFLYICNCCIFLYFSSQHPLLFMSLRMHDYPVILICLNVWHQCAEKLLSKTGHRFLICIEICAWLLNLLRYDMVLNTVIPHRTDYSHMCGTIKTAFLLLCR